MKKLGIGLIAMSMSVAVSAQKNKVISANNYLNYKEYDKAMVAINEASKHESTVNYWKTWYFKGKIYREIAMSNDPAVKSLSPNAIQEAASAFKKALTYDDKRMDKNEIQGLYASLTVPAFNGGVSAYQANDFAKAIEMFQVSENINKDKGIVDSVSIYNIALAALKSEQQDLAISYLDKCITSGIKGAIPFVDKALLLMKTDENAALEVMKAGRAKYPNDQDLLTQELNIYLKNERFDEALANLNQAIEQDPGNFIFYFARGTIFDNKKDIEKAEVDYKKAIELKSDHFDSYYNLGALFYNQGAEMLQKANEIPPSKPKEYEAAKAAAVEVLKKSLPHLEKAHELNDTDRNCIISLKTVYTMVGETQKAIDISKKLAQ